MESTIVFKKRELLVVEDYWKKVLEARPTAFSFMTAKGKDLLAEINEGTLSVKDVMDIQQEHHDREVFFWLTKGEPTYHTDSVQPFVVLGAADNALILGMADGPFTSFVDKERSNEWAFFNKYLIPKLHSLGKTSDAIFNSIANDIFAMEMRNMCGANGSLILLGENGRNVTFSGYVPHQFEWGWTTENHGYEEVSKPVEEVKIAPSIVRKVRQIISSPIISRPVASTEPIKQPDIVTREMPALVPPKTATAIPPIKDQETFLPTKGLSNKETKREYESFSLKMRGFRGLPDHKTWHQRQPWTLTRTVPMKDFKDIPKPEPVKTAESAVVEGIVPVIPPNILEAMEGDFKDLDLNGREIPPPEDILNDMDKFSTFWEQRGIEKAVTDAWTDEALQLLCTKYANHSWILLKNYRELLLANEGFTRQAAEAATAENAVDTSGTGVETKPIPKWKQALDKKRKTAM